MQLKNRPSFSVIIPTWNRPQLLSRAIQSVYACEGSYDVEIIVVDNASVPPVNLDSFQVEKNILLIRMDSNVGPSIARNVAIKNAKNEFIIPLDDDDELVLDALNVIGNYVQLGTFNQYPVLFFKCNSNCNELVLYSFIQYLTGPFSESKPVISKHYWTQELLKFPDLKIGGESLLWIDVAKNFGLPVVQKEIIHYHSGAPNQLTSLNNQIIRAAEYMDYQWQVINKVYSERHAVYPFYKKKVKAFAVYSILAGNRKDALKKAFHLDKGAFCSVFVLCLLPKKILQYFLLLYRSARYHENG